MRKRNKLKRAKLKGVIEQIEITTPTPLLTLTLIILLTAFLTIILSINLASAIGVTYPQPQNIELVPGQSSYFTFQIQSDDFPIVCVPIIEETQGLEFVFDQEYIVEANQRYNVKPQIIVPKQSAFGTYTPKFCIECSPSSEIAGSKIIPKICNLPITVNAVSERTRENMFGEIEAKKYLFLWITLLIVVIIILALIIIYLLKRKRKSQNKL